MVIVLILPWLCQKFHEKREAMKGRKNNKDLVESGIKTRRKIIRNKVIN